MTFQTEFPDFPAADFPALPPGFEDSSWGNDICPCMTSKTAQICIFIDYADVILRELGADSDRFVVMPLDADGCHTGEQPMLATDDWSEVLTFLAKRT